MSYHVFFAFSTGIKRAMLLPEGTIGRIHQHVREAEGALGLVATQYKENPKHWEGAEQAVIAAASVDYKAKKTVCAVVQDHNDWVRSLYDIFNEATPFEGEVPAGKEVLTPEECSTFFHATEMLAVPVHLWSAEYYIAEMEALYEVMRGRPTNGITFDTAKLTPKQAAAVVNLFAGYLDPDSRDLDVPNGHDYLASSYDGGYKWCEKCGSVAEGDISRQEQNCRRKKCPLVAEAKEWERDLNDAD
jgi:hypothetical protein